MTIFNVRRRFLNCFASDSKSHLQRLLILSILAGMENQKDDMVSVRDGSYFRDARDWYDVCYWSLLTERAWYVVISILGIVFFILAVTAIIKLLPLSPSVSYTYLSKDGVNTVARMRRMEGENEGEDPNVSLRRYLAEEYVERREMYSVARLSGNVLYVYNNSSDAVAAAFRQYMDKSNPRSPVVMYQASTERKVTVFDVLVEKDEEAAGENKYIAYVDFSASLARDGEYVQTFHQAELHFDYTDLTFDQTDEEVIQGKPLKIVPMTFKVTAYSAKQRK